MWQGSWLETAEYLLLTPTKRSAFKVVQVGLMQALRPRKMVPKFASTLRLHICQGLRSSGGAGPSGAI